jgi:hypothetical protein
MAGGSPVVQEHAVNFGSQQSGVKCHSQRRANTEKPSGRYFSNAIACINRPVRLLILAFLDYG